MYFQINKTKYKGKTYRSLKLVRSYREKGKIKKEIIVNFGNMERFSDDDIDKIIEGLSKVFNKPKPCGKDIEFLDLKGQW